MLQIEPKSKGIAKGILVLDEKVCNKNEGIHSQTSCYGHTPDAIFRIYKRGLIFVEERVKYVATQGKQNKIP